jgi:hemoglobin-like flavoprotein
MNYNAYTFMLVYLSGFMLQAMGKRHIIYGVEAAHFETVGAALLSALGI